MNDPLCRCGHPRSAHEHYTVPGDLRCGLCDCRRFRKAMTHQLDADEKLLARSGRAAEAAELASVGRSPVSPLQAAMGCPPPVWENQDNSKLADGGCVIFNGSRRCGASASAWAWIGCTVGEHLDRSSVCAAHAKMLGRDRSEYSCRRCWDATGQVSKAKVIKIEDMNDDDDAQAAPGQSPDLLP